MGWRDWLGRSTRAEAAHRGDPPEPLEMFGEDSPIVGFMTGESLVLTDRDSFEHQFMPSDLPAPSRRSLDGLLKQTTRVRVRGAGMYRGEALPAPVLLDVADPAALTSLRSALSIRRRERNPGHCSCLGGPTLELLAGDQVLATIGLQHGNAIRWAAWRGDARLIDGDRLSQWLIEHGVAPQLLRTLYGNPFPFGFADATGSDVPLSRTEQRLYVTKLRQLSGDLDGALSECDAILEDEPGNPLAHARRGHVHSARGEHEACVTDLTVALKRGDEQAETLHCRAVAYDELGRHEEAVADCTRALEIEPGHAASRNSRGLIYMKMGRLENARSDLDTAIALSPEWEVPVANRAVLAESESDWVTSIAHYSRAIDLLSRNEGAAQESRLAALHWHRGQVKAKTGDERGAHEDRETARRLAPDLFAEPHG